MLQTEPEDRYFESSRLKLHYTAWGDETKPPLLLVHGGRDHARSWDFVAQAMLDRYSVYCPDLRGHGDSGWSIGGSYPLTNYITDLARLVEEIGRGPVQIVGHSLGGRIVLDYAAAVPESVSKLVCIEGFGRLTRAAVAAPDRLRNYIKHTGEMPKQKPVAYTDLDAAIERMAEQATLTRDGAPPDPARV